MRSLACRVPARTLTTLVGRALLAGVLASGVSGAAHAGGNDDGSDYLKVFGDFRLRFETDFDSQTRDGSGRDDRSRWRIRARFGAQIDPVPHLSFGFRIRTGPTDAQQSPHFTIWDITGNPNGPNGVVWDKWFAEAKKGNASVWAGRNSFPFWTQNELFWDEDATPAGLAVRYSHSVGGGTLTANGGYFALPDGMKRFIPYLGAGQLVYASELGGVTLTAAAGGFFFDGRSGAENLRNGNGARDYILWVGNLQAKGELAGMPITVGGDFIHNSEDYSAADPDPFTVANRDETDGYVAQITFGRLKVRGDWLAAYYYAHIETLSVNASFAQDDWHRFGSASQTDASDFEGHEFRLAYALGKNVNLLARLYVVDAITSIQDGNRFRLDLNYRF